MSENKSVPFVCLGNICRSPLAEAVFQDIVNKRGLTDKITRIDSAGTGGYHVGSDPDERSVATCRKHNVPINSTCRQLERADFNEFDVIVGMDHSNMSNMERVRPKGSKAKVALFGSYGDGKVIEDPYYGGNNGFEKTYQQCVEYSEGLLADLGFPKQAGGK
ncbi:low molecular weight phosphotyrosine protein phosphatase, partial [Phenoliferia sp. Uapishka_3]